MWNICSLLQREDERSMSLLFGVFKFFPQTLVLIYFFYHVVSILYNNIVGGFCFRNIFFSFAITSWKIASTICSFTHCIDIYSRVDFEHWTYFCLFIFSTIAVCCVAFVLVVWQYSSILAHLYHCIISISWCSPFTNSILVHDHDFCINIT